MKLILWLIFIIPAYATDLRDFAVMSRCWEKPRCWECRQYDYTGNGVVDLVDLMIFAERWLEVSLPNQVIVDGGLNPDIAGVYANNGSNVYTKSFTFGSGTAYVQWLPVLSKWRLFISDGESPAYTYIWISDDAIETNPVGTYSPAEDNLAEGTATVTEYTGANMADFNYYNNIGTAEKCFRIVNFNTNQVWDTSGTPAMKAYASVAGANYANGNTALTLQAGMPGYAVDIPSGVPEGDYDILIFDAAASAATAADYEMGYQFRYSSGTIKNLKQRLSDAVL